MSSSSSSAQKSSNTTQDLTVVGAEGSVTAGANSNTTAAMAEDGSIGIGSADSIHIEQFSDEAFELGINYLNNSLVAQSDAMETNANLLESLAASVFDVTKKVYEGGSDFLLDGTGQLLTANQSEGERLTSQSMYIVGGVAIAAFFLFSNPGLFS
jgi:hypothetical protein